MFSRGSVNEKTFTQPFIPKMPVISPTSTKSLADNALYAAALAASLINLATRSDACAP